MPISFLTSQTSPSPVTSRLRFGAEKPDPAKTDITKPSPADTFTSSAKPADPKSPNINSSPLPDLQNLTQQWLAFEDQLVGFIESYQKTGQDPKVLKETLIELSWQQLFEQQLLKNPAQSAQKLLHWENTIQTEGAPGVLRDSAVLAIRYLRTHLNQPDKLKQANRILVELMLAGGYKKAIKIARLFSEDRFTKATPIQKGQYLIEALGPLVTKLFQTLSTVPGLFPDHVQASLKPLYQNITPVPGPAIIKVIEESLEKPIGELYAKFNPEPVHVASIAQVHEAWLHPTGNQKSEKVAVKVVKPGLIDTMIEDLQILDPLVLLIKELAPHLDMNQLFNTFATQLLEECDMTKEAEKLKSLLSVYANEPKTTVPKVYDAQSSDTVLTMSWMDAKSLSHFENTPRAKVIAKRFWQLILDQVFRYGVYQADPHPGNVPYSAEKSKFALLDAGQIYWLSEEDRVRFGKLIVSISMGLGKQTAEFLLKPVTPNAITPTEKQARQQFEAWVTAELKTVSPTKDLAQALGFLNRSSKKAAELNLPFAGVDPQLMKCLFVGMMVTKTLDKDAPVLRQAVQTLLRRVLVNDCWFATEVAKDKTVQLTGQLAIKANQVVSQQVIQPVTQGIQKGAVAAKDWVKAKLKKWF
jgi:predicted unusual protein kinase regulating ubiquinone biosynthesis (AarF/ABC1/UbiB family)